jgi:hypothetical protein
MNSGEKMTAGGSSFNAGIVAYHEPSTLELKIK